MSEFANASSAFGTLNGWVPQQGGDPTTTKTRASALGSNGDEFRHTDHSQKDSVSCDYCADDEVDTASVPKAGEILNGYYIDTVHIDWNPQDFPKLKVTGHKHDGKAHTACRTYQGSLSSISTALGVPSSIGPLSSTAPTGASYELTCQHNDTPGGSGEIVGSGSYDGSETFTMESVESISVSDTSGEYTVESDASNKSNTDFTKKSKTVTRHFSGTNPA